MPDGPFYRPLLQPPQVLRWSPATLSQEHLTPHVRSPGISKHGKTCSGLVRFHLPVLRESLWCGTDDTMALLLWPHIIKVLVRKQMEEVSTTAPYSGTTHSEGHSDGRNKKAKSKSVTAPRQLGRKDQTCTAAFRTHLTTQRNRKHHKIGIKPNLQVPTHTYEELKPLEILLEYPFACTSITYSKLGTSSHSKPKRSLNVCLN